MTYPRLRTDYGEPGKPCHLAVEITYSDGAASVRVCGDSWCTGKCGLPAAVIPARDNRPELKMHSAMVALGPVMQSFRVAWTGARIEIPVEHWTDLEAMYWL